MSRVAAAFFRYGRSLKLTPTSVLFVEHWTVAAFASYVKGLAAAADGALSVATPDEQAEAIATFLEVAQLEADFWQMAYAT